MTTALRNTTPRGGNYASAVLPKRKRVASIGLLGSTALVATFAVCMPAAAAEVTYQRLLNAASEPQNWLMRMGNYSNWNHSALNAINRGNVANLKVKFIAALGDPTRPNKATEYFTPLVEDGFMYVGNQWQQYWKFDVRNEKPTVVWKFDAKVQNGGKSAHSVALLGNNMYFNTGSDSPNPRLVALDKNSGEVVFDVATTTPEVVPNQGHSSAPLAIKDIILVGQANAATRTGAAMYRPIRPIPANFSGGSYRSQSGPAGFGDLGRPAHHSDGRSRRVDRTVIRSGDQSGVFWHRQPGTYVRPAGTPRRQSLCKLHHRARCRYREAEMVLPDDPQRSLGL